MKLKRKIAMMVTTIAIAISITVPAYAAKGKLTFSHGINKSEKTTFGSITSTDYEKSMEIMMVVRNANTGAYNMYTSQEYKDACYLRLTKKATGIKGASYCYYYVDGTKKHQSTAWYDFDFR